MNKEDKNRVYLALSLFLPFFIGFVVLLLYGFILSNDFMKLTATFAVLGLIIAYSPYISEITFAGASVKLRRLKTKAEQAIQNLKSATADNLKIQLKLVLLRPDTFPPAEYPKDLRIENFWILYDSIKETYRTPEVEKQLHKTVEELLKGQLQCFKRALEGYDSDFNNIMTPDELSDKLKHSSIREFNRLNEDQKKQRKQEIESAYQDYEKLYDIYKNLSNNQ